MSTVLYVAQINPTVAQIQYNCKLILQQIERARSLGAQLLIFPELAITGYPPDDFLLLSHFIDEVEEAIQIIANQTSGLTAIVGTPRRNRSAKGKALYNSAALLSRGQILGYSDKILLPTYDVFDERRYFEPGEWRGYWLIEGMTIAVTLCEDIWYTTNPNPLYSCDPILQIAKEPQPPQLLVNLSASPFSVDHPQRRIDAAKRVAIQLQAPVLLCNQVGANDCLIFDGASFCLDREGNLLKQASSFVEDSFTLESRELAEGRASCDYSYQEQPSPPFSQIYRALVLGVRDYFAKLGFQRACLGLSGGIDSAVVAAIAVEALGAENVFALMMPSRYSSIQSIEDAKLLANRLGLTLHEISIEPLFERYLETLSPYFAGKEWDTTEENLQARIRGNLLMSFSNKFGSILLSTGNKSEMAVGYCTLYGDMCGGLAVINDLSKARVYGVARYINRDRELIPLSILNKEPSAELKENQKDSDTLPPYPILDTIVEEYLEEQLAPSTISTTHDYPLELVEKIVSMIHRNEYKRRQAPPGLRITDKAFSSGRRFPIVERWAN